MLKIISVILVIVVLGGIVTTLRDRSPVPDSPEDIANYNSAKGMNGIVFDHYDGFQNEWHLVTVRYRADSGEQRFTYANDAAYKALLEGKNEYPDGAIFGKIGIMTEDDPSFASSRVPSGAVRYQLMVRDKKKYASTGGWGYALNTGIPERMPQEELTKSCVVCHNLVKDRNYVFSWPMNFHMHVVGKQPLNLKNPLLTFSDHEPKQLPHLLQQGLPPGTKNVRFLEGEARQHLFLGTLFELIPSLTNESVRTGVPSALVAEDGVSFLLVSPMTDYCGASVGFVCGPNEKPYSAIFRASTDPNSQIYHETSCARVK